MIIPCWFERYVFLSTEKVRPDHYNQSNDHEFNNNKCQFKKFLVVEYLGCTSFYDITFIIKYQYQKRVLSFTTGKHIFNTYFIYVIKYNFNDLQWNENNGVKTLLYYETIYLMNMPIYQTLENKKATRNFFFTIPTCTFLYTPPTSLFVFYDLLFVLLFVLDFPKVGNET